MRQIIATLKSVSPYSQSRFHNTPKLEKEGNDDYEKRTWRERVHVNDDGFIFIPPMAFKNCLSECAKYLSMQIPGKGKQTYTKHFEAGVLVTEPLVLPVRKEEVAGMVVTAGQTPGPECMIGEWFYVPAQGDRGGKKRVWRCFPMIPSWQGDVIFYILDDTITEKVFRYHLEQSGKFIGIGRFRPRNNGFYGRFEVIDLVVG